MVEQVEAMGDEVEETARRTRNGSSSMVKERTELMPREVGKTCLLYTSDAADE